MLRGRSIRHEQLQQLPLDMPREHAGLDDPQMRLAVEFVQKILFRRRKVVNISFECIHISVCPIVENRYL